MCFYKWDWCLDRLKMLFANSSCLIIELIVILSKRVFFITQSFILLALSENRLRVVPHFSSGIVEWAKRERAWKSPHARKGDTRRGERKMRDYRQSPSFWTFVLPSQRKTLTGYSMEICQHLSKTHQPLSTLDIITIYSTNNWSRTNNSREQITSKSCSCRSN